MTSIRAVCKTSLGPSIFSSLVTIGGFQVVCGDDVDSIRNHGCRLSVEDFLLLFELKLNCLILLLHCLLIWIFVL